MLTTLSCLLGHNIWLTDLEIRLNKLLVCLGFKCQICLISLGGAHEMHFTPMLMQRESSRGYPLPVLLLTFSHTCSADYLYCIAL